MSNLRSPIDHGYLVLADISGYTFFLSQTELDHAHEILTDLIETVLKRFKPLLTIHKLEGDAVFAYVSDAHLLRGETLLELVEGTYVDFRERMKNVRRHTTCTCRACQSIPLLDLKFIVHHGDFVRQSIGGTPELAGSDVNLVHRLLKNHVFETTGWKAYALFTASALDCMGLQLEHLVQGAESYDSLGDTRTYAMDLHARYEEIVQARRVFVTPQDADRTLEFDSTASPPVVWEWFNDPVKRGRWMGLHIIPVTRVGGRLAPGARNHCLHGKNEMVVEDLMDIRPFEYFTIDQSLGASMGMLRMTWRFRPSGEGTHVSLMLRIFGGSLPHWTSRLIGRLFFEPKLRESCSFERLDQLIVSDSPPG
ncbi:MAG TPA: DUF2652 domain-containing protein [Anaerolineales bacterium]